MDITPNQLVALNLSRARHIRGWTQAEASDRIATYLGRRWSKATFSVAERSIDHPERIRAFTADDVLAFSGAFDLPPSFFYDPPSGGDFTTRAKGAAKGWTEEELRTLTRSDVNEKVGAMIAAHTADIASKEGIGIEVEPKGRVIARGGGVIPEGKLRQPKQQQPVKED